MTDPSTFALSQKMTWVKMLHDDTYESLWKSMELSILEKFCQKEDILWRAHAPESVLYK